MNPKDPILKASPDAERELFDRLTQAANGFQRDQVIGASANVIVNALRQTHATRRAALDDFDALTARVRALIASHYDGTGKRRNVFPFHQHIEVPMLDARTGRNRVN